MAASKRQRHAPGGAPSGIDHGEAAFASSTARPITELELRSCSSDGGMQIWQGSPGDLKARKGRSDLLQTRNMVVFASTAGKMDTADSEWVLKPRRPEHVIATAAARLERALDRASGLAAAPAGLDAQWSGSAGVCAGDTAVVAELLDRRVRSLFNQHAIIDTSDEDSGRCGCTAAPQTHTLSPSSAGAVAVATR